VKKSELGGDLFQEGHRRQISCGRGQEMPSITQNFPLRNFNEHCVLWCLRQFAEVRHIGVGPASPARQKLYDHTSSATDNRAAWAQMRYCGLSVEGLHNPSRSNIGQVNAPAAKSEHVARKRILLKRRLHHHAQPRKTTPQIRHPCGDPDMRSPWQPDHLGKHSSTKRRVSTSTRRVTQSCPSDSLIFVDPSTLGRVPLPTR